MRPVLVLALAGAFLPSMLAAQRVPGTGNLIATEAREAQYAQEVLGLIRPQLDIWRSAWDATAAEDFAQLYTHDAILIFGTQPVVGEGAIKSYFSEIAPSISNMTISFTDFRASGIMATMIGQYSYNVRRAGRVGERIEGTYMASFVRRGSDWVIRSQLFRAPFPDSIISEP